MRRRQFTSHVELIGTYKVHESELTLDRVHNVDIIKYGDLCSPHPPTMYSKYIRSNTNYDMYYLGLLAAVKGGSAIFKYALDNYTGTDDFTTDCMLSHVIRRNDVAIMQLMSMRQLECCQRLNEALAIHDR